MSATEMDRCPTCQHRVMFHGEDCCSTVLRVLWPDGPAFVARCPCTATRQELLR